MAERHKLYEIDPTTRAIKLKNRLCPKCGRVMGYYKHPQPRWYCGYCHHVEYERTGK
ncbi:MAG: 30S ribosomal protein S27ae [Zestosphaera tikiterensis]|uniref:30S ribosomal protein S27ae n=1 Tax=Zestosphaera tikiterensis TaxID=1973259 RepID=A0A2R7Y7U8_9CREN|nr:MAG: 30S ribosomal protein S27ae [Zestosphaera tikiterensis]